MLTEALDAGAIRDAVIAQSVADVRALWAIRECTAEFPVRLDPINFDVSLPIGEIGAFVDVAARRSISAGRATRRISSAISAIRICM